MAGPLRGVGILVTRPESQADELCRSLAAAGGRVVRCPVMDIVPRAADAVSADLAAIPRPDRVVFVSANAVRYGLAALAEPQPAVAAIGPATAAALERAGVAVDVLPAAGYTSEQLLATPEFAEVAGMRVLIVRGESGRELLAETLRSRGAEVDYLSVYRVETHRCSGEELDALRQALGRGEIDATVLMSAAALAHMLAALPGDCIDRIAGTRLVAPGARVIQTVQERLPGTRCVEAPGPLAGDIVAALIDSFESDPVPP